MIQRISALLSENAHNYIVCFLTLCYGAVVCTVLVSPDATRLAMAKDVGTTLIGVFGVVAGTHGAKSIAMTMKGPADTKTG